MALDVTDLSAGYGDVTVLRGVTCSVSTNSVAALLGANGAGKTTTLNAISGLQANVSSGTVRLEGIDITRMPAHERVEACARILNSEATHRGRGDTRRTRLTGSFPFFPG
jgi:branched-chain amino acid transport system ATP-binding protein